MKLKSLGQQTDLIFARFSGEIGDADDYISVRTPSNPSFYWGNFLIFAGAPQEGDFERWMMLFADKVGTPPETAHVAFTWDSNEQEAVTEPFIAAGFSYERTVVMTAQALQPPTKHNSEVEIRTLNSDQDFAELIEAKLIVGLESGFEKTRHRIFLERHVVNYRKMIAAGVGLWFGGYLGGRLVSDLGLFRGGKLARYQLVDTLPTYRRQGLASTLVYEVGKLGLERWGVEELVILADADYFAKDIYASVGFETKEVMEALVRRPSVQMQGANDEA